MKKIKIRGNYYVQVNERIIFFRSAKQFEGWGYDSQVIKDDGKYIQMKVSVFDSNGEPKSSGHAEEIRGSSNINKTSALENCETSALGRALGGLGIGVKEAMASAEEVQNAIMNQDKKASTKTSIDSKRTLSADQYFQTLKGTKEQIENVLKAFDMPKNYRQNLNAKIKQL